MGAHHAADLYAVCLSVHSVPAPQVFRAAHHSVMTALQQSAPSMPAKQLMLPLLAAELPGVPYSTVQAIVSCLEQTA